MSRKVLANNKENNISPGVSAEVIQNHAEGLESALQAQPKDDENPFPIEAVPHQIQCFIKDVNEALNFPPEYTGAAILFAFSVGIGSTHKVEVKNGWQENCILYISIEGLRGTSKSHPINLVLKPFEQADNKNFKKYMDEIEAYNAQKQEEGKKPQKPILKQYLVNDYTPEALIDVFDMNNRGLGVYIDELVALVNNFNRYNKGSEEQFWLTNWSGKPFKKNRKTCDPINLPSTFISLIGTIQLGVLNELAKSNRTESGFFDRLLHVLRNKYDKKPWSEKELDASTLKNWEDIIDKVLELELNTDKFGNPEPKILKFTTDAKQLLFKWQEKLTNETNKKKNEVISGISAKIEVYAIRFALILLPENKYVCFSAIKDVCFSENKDVCFLENKDVCLCIKFRFLYR